MASRAASEIAMRIIASGGRGGLQGQVDRPALAPHHLGDLGGAHALPPQLEDPRTVELDRPALVDALRLGGLYAGALPVADEPVLHLGDHAEHGQHHLPHRPTGVDRGLQHPEAGAPLLELVDEIEHVAGRAAQPIELVNDEGVAWPDEVENRGQLVAAVAGELLGANDGAAGRRERGLLDRRVLIGGADAGVADQVRRRRLGLRLGLGLRGHGVVTPAMELGGNAPVLVFEDADIETAVEGSMVAKMRNIGEACTAANRFYVHESMADAFAERLTARMAALKMGDGLEEGVDVGPLVNAETRDKVAALVDDAVARGAELRLGGAIPNRRGFFYPPTVLIRVPADAAGGNFWARRGPSDVSRSGGSGRARERHEIRPR